MKNLIYLLFIFAFLSACQEDEAGFDVGMQASDITFKSIAGGAILHYSLPSDDNVFRLKVSYVDVQGNSCVRFGSYACDSLEINGFNEALEGVRAKISLCNRQDEESKPMDMTFNTLDSGPVAFFKTAKVEPYWDGFILTYEGQPYAKGMAHVLFAGKDPQTQQPDTLLLESFPIIEGKDTMSFSLQNPNPTNTVIVRTEDYRGYRVKQQEWKDVKSYSSKLLKLEASDFLDTEGLVVNESMMGVEYLFDGDTKGERSFEYSSNSKKMCTFMAGPHVKGKPFILDLREKHVPAFVRIYSMLFVRYFPNNVYWGWQYMNRLPSAVSIYVSNDKDDDTSWVKLGGYEEPNDAPFQSRWGYRCPMAATETLLKTMDDIRRVEPCYMTIRMPAAETSWRYLKLVVDELFLEGPQDKPNSMEYVTFNELEVYVKSN